MKPSFTSLLNRAPETSGIPSGEWRVYSPSQTDEEIGKCLYRYSDIELATSEAQSSFTLLQKTSFDDRLTEVVKAISILRSAKQMLFETSALELGRGLNDFETEWSQLERFFDSLEKGSTKPTSHAQARGTTTIIGSYVWPVFYSIQFSFLNFLAGNPAILKPSEKSTVTVLKLFGLLREKLEQFSSIQVLVGEREMGRRLACHESISTVIFQGSFEVGMRVKQDTLSQPGKQILLYLGAKNPFIIFKDSPKEVYETLLKDAFQGTGQNCQSASVAFVESSFIDEFTDRFHELSKQFKIGRPESGAFMGPLIDGAMLDRYLKFIGISEREGAEIIMRGKPLPGAGKGHFVTPTLVRFSSLSPEQMKKSVTLQTEILSPHLSIVGFDRREDLLLVLRQMNHGRNAAIWTEQIAQAKQLASLLEYGSVSINQSMLELDLSQTFQSRKRSGNHALLGQGLSNQLVFGKLIQVG